MKKKMRIRLFLSLILSLTCVVSAQSWDQVIRLVSSDRASDDCFGYSVAISGDYAIVGAYYEKEDASGVNTLTGAGSAYLFKNTLGVWSQVQKIVPVERSTNAYFGYSVAISGDYAIVGASAEEAAYIFKNTAGTWHQLHKFVPSDDDGFDQFGVSVSISGDYAIVGANYKSSSTGAAYIFKNTEGTWSEVQKIVPSDGAINFEFGISVSISGDYLVVGAWGVQSDRGAAYIFKNNAGTWIQDQVIQASDGSEMDDFGWSVAISGDYIIVGADQDFVDENGNNSLNRAGSAYIFKNNSGTWSQVKKLVASDREAGDYFGYSVAISGDYAIVGAINEDEGVTGTNAGAAYVFKNTAGVWGQVQKIVASGRATDAFFGWSVAMLNEFAFVGAYGETLGAGAVYVFSDPSATPVELVHFSGHCVNREVELIWETATEVNNYGFQIERKVETEINEWENIGFVQGYGTSNSTKSYTFTDSNLPEVNQIEYRLKQIDNDGTFSYSKVITVILHAITDIEEENVKYEFALEQNYPNPFNPTTTIKFTIPSNVKDEILNTKLTVYDILGREVATLVNQNLQPGNHQVQCVASSLSSGMYFYRINIGDKYNAVNKLMILK